MVTFFFFEFFKFIHIITGVYSFLYARLKKGTYYVTGYGVVSSQLLLQFTSDQAETWYIVRPWCGAVHIVSGLQATKCLQSYAPLKISVNFSFPVNSSYILHPIKLKLHL